LIEREQVDLVALSRMSQKMKRALQRAAARRIWNEMRQPENPHGCRSTPSPFTNLAAGGGDGLRGCRKSLNGLLGQGEALHAAASKYNFRRSGS
jgi:hypothetical protein